MGLQLILGGSGTGKTTAMYSEMISRSIEDNKTKYLAIVPEQFTMETQKAIVELSPRKGTMAIDILSFDRLAKRIFAEAGMNTIEVLDDTGKCLIIRKIIEENKKKLTVFGSKVKMAGFIDEMKSMVSELYQYGIGEKQLDEMLEKSKEKPLLYAKLEDIKLILSELRKYLEDRFVMNEELLQKVCELIPKSKLVKGSYITFDEYTGFSPVQYNVIIMLLKYAKKVTIALTVRDADTINFENVDGSVEVFGLTIKTVNKLRRMAKDEGITVYDDIILTENLRSKDNDELKYLEKNLFKYGKEPFDVKNKDAVSICVCQNMEKEIEYVACMAKKLVREKGYRYKEMAVVTADIASYSRIVTEVFNKNDIPCFIDYKRNIISNPMVESLRAVLEIISENYSYEAIFRLLKGGMTSLDRSEIDRLENYVISRGIRGYKRYSNEFDTEIEGINETREKFLEDIAEIHNIFKSSRRITVREAITALYNFSVKLNMESKLLSMKKYFEGNNNLSLAKEYAQTYGKVMGLFDKTVFLIGDEMVNSKEILEILDSGFEDMKVGIIPPTLDRMVVGDITRTRLSNVKVMFLVGANDELIPKSNPRGGVLTRIERNFLAENDVELSPTVEENVFIQKYYLYLILTKMSDSLYVTFKRINSDGSSARQSYIINSLIKMFKGISVIDLEHKEKIDSIDRITNLRAAKSFVAENVRSYVTELLNRDRVNFFREVSAICRRNDINIDDVIEASIYEAKGNKISEAISKAIYGEDLHNSVSRLERFAACAYQHFINYGLMLMPRKEFEVNSADIGNIYHSAIELFSKKVTNRNISWEKLDDELRDMLINESVNEAVELDGGAVFLDNARNAYIVDRIKTISKKTAWILQQQIKSGKFIPKDFEVRFSSDFGLEDLSYAYENGTKMGLKGVIDRIDYYNNGDDIYVRIVDYKSGNKKFEINDVYNGLQLQLVLYMEAAISKTRKDNPGKNVIPAGIFYYNIDNPVVDSDAIYKNSEVIKADTDSRDRVIKACLDEQVLKEQKVDGVVNDSKEVLGAMDKAFELEDMIGKDSKIIPFGYNSKGDVKSSSKAASVFDMEKLIKYVHDKVGELGEDILKGKIDVNPYVKASKNGTIKGIQTPCAYCEFSSICGFDKKVKGYENRLLAELDEEEVWCKIRLESRGVDDGKLD